MYELGLSLQTGEVGDGTVARPDLLKILHTGEEADVADLRVADHQRLEIGDGSGLAEICKLGVILQQKVFKVLKTVERALFDAGDLVLVGAKLLK